jgi:hypothetical protein
MKRLRIHPMCVWLSFSALIMLACPGCGGGRSDLGQVSGVVMLDGQPLPHASLLFQPDGPGSPSFGQTDGSGRYFLQYDRDTQGAMLGMHTIKISTAVPGDEEASPPVAEVPERVPPRYNAETELTRKVNAGSNEIDFELESE